MTPTNLNLGRINKVFDAAKQAGNKWVQLLISPSFWSPKWVLNSVKTAPFNVQYGHQEKGVNLPLPLPYNTDYLNDWAAFVKAISVVYGGNPNFRMIAAAGPTSVSDEFTEPDKPIDVDEWKSAKYGYTFSQYIQAWDTMFGDYAADFKNQYVSLSHGNGITKPAQTVKDLVRDAHNILGNRFVFQSSALTGRAKHHAVDIASVIARIGLDGTGFQTPSPTFEFESEQFIKGVTSVAR